MKRCPTCNRTYTDLSLNFCLEDGTPLATDAAGGPDPNATLRYPSPRDTAEPPPTEIYRPAPSTASTRPEPAPPPPPPPPQWSPTPTQAPRKKSNAVWWILGGFAALLVIGVGLVVMLIALASLGSDSNSNLNANNSNTNRNANVTANANANVPNSNASVTPGGPLTDDFTEKKWNVGNSQFGRMWYENDEYHMSAKPQMFIVIYAPSEDYSTENATVKVTARMVDDTVPSNGFGLMVHCGWSRAKKLDDYALLIYPSDEPEYEIIMHKDGTQSSLVARTKSNAILSGTSPNKLEVRIKGTDLSFYANGQFLTRINDTENYRRGRAGFYTSDVTNVAFDNLEIDR